MSRGPGGSPDPLPEEDDALRWGDETDSSHAEGPAPARARAAASGPAASGVTADLDSPAGGRAAPSSFLLVTYGILAGVYLLYTVGWGFVVVRTLGTSADLLGTIMFQLGQFLAIVAAPLWFFAAFVLTRDNRPVIRLLWLIIGIVMLVPLPFILGV